MYMNICKGIDLCNFVLPAPLYLPFFFFFCLLHMCTNFQTLSREELCIFPVYCIRQVISNVSPFFCCVVIVGFLQRYLLGQITISFSGWKLKLLKGKFKMVYWLWLIATCPSIFSNDNLSASTHIGYSTK